ncbi:hypothetical protein CABS03_11814 [Colletotrichum abscissum]|uniref:Ankyrin repeat protein n=1 Tax=Colletotrichum abscissum TaxID=1671311 RepID=A0A9P9X057_9PEZI|nr:hypothetical protein CABS02_15258 [Colletotrichum abscissum]
MDADTFDGMATGAAASNTPSRPIDNDSQTMDDTHASESPQWSKNESARSLPWKEVDHTMTPQAETPLHLFLGELDLESDAEAKLAELSAILAASPEDIDTRSLEPPHKTPLQIAIEKDVIRAFNLLIQADLGIVDRNGWSPLMTALRESTSEIFDILVNHLFEPGRELTAKDVISRNSELGVSIFMEFRRSRSGDEAWEASFAKLLANILENFPDLEFNTTPDYEDLLGFAMFSTKHFKNKTMSKFALRVIDWVPKRLLFQRFQEDAAFMDELLCWLACQQERHYVAVSILKELPAQEQTGNIDQNGWTLAHWAIYHRLPSVLLRCPPLTPSDKTRGLEIIGQLKKSSKTKEQQPFAKDSAREVKQENQSTRNEEGRTETHARVLDGMKHILDFIGLETTLRAREPLRITKPTSSGIKDCLNEFQASIVEVRQNENEFSMGTRFRGVYNTIYDEKESFTTIRDAIEQFQKSTKKWAPSTQVSGKGFTWVHLPAANMPFILADYKRNETNNNREDFQDILNGYYQSRGSVVHDAPTLDEHYYHFAADEESQRDRGHRNKNQVFTKYLQENKTEWLITSASCAEIDNERTITFINSIVDHLRTQVEDGSRERGPNSAAELSRSIAEYCVGTYDRQQEGRQEADLYGQFSGYTRTLRQEEETSSSHGNPLTTEEAVKKAAQLLFEIKDVRDELNILRTVAEFQRKVQSRMDGREPNTISNVLDADLTAAYVRNDIDEMDKLAGRIRDACLCLVSGQHISRQYKTKRALAILARGETSRKQRP